MGFKQAVAQDAMLVMFNTAEFAELVIYNGATIPAVVELGPEQAAGNMFASDGEADRATIYVLTKDVPDPSRGDIVEVGTTVWEVVRTIGSNPAVQTLSCIANERPGW